MNLRRHTELKMVDGKLYQGTREPLARRDAGPCPFCNLSVMVSSGQLITYFNGSPTHKVCRKEYQKKGKSGKLNP